MDEASVVVVRLSAMFGELWTTLQEGLHAPVVRMAPSDIQGMPRCSAVLLAAGGAERDAMDWLSGRDLRSGPPVYVVGSDPGRRAAAQVIAHGAADYFALPDDSELLRNALTNELRRSARQFVAGVAGEGEDAESFRRLVGESPAWRAVLTQAARVVQHARATVVIAGEPGTGKELLARAIHDGGPRRHAPFVAIDCATVAAGRIEQELFGHEKGTIAGAHPAGPGLLEVAAGGTVLLENVTTLSADLQTKLLRILEQGAVRRLGGTRSRPVDVRVIAATTEDLGAAVRAGRFLPDLHLRIGAVSLELPPLRERGDDLFLIAQHLLDSLAELHAVPAPPLTADVRRVLAEHTWPGNVQELRHALERALLLSPGGRLVVTELLPRRSAPRLSPVGGLPFPAELHEITAAAARGMLEVCDGNVSEAARRLKISRSRLRRLMRASGPHAFEAMGGVA